MYLELINLQKIGKILKNLIKKIDNKIFNLLSLINYTLVDLKLFFYYHLKNLKNSKPDKKDDLNLSKKITNLKFNGIIKLQNFYDTVIIKDLEKDFNSLKNNFKNLSPIKIDGDINGQFLEKEFFDKGENYFKKLVKNIQIRDPFVMSPNLLKIALNQTFIKIAKNYFNTDEVYVTGVNYRRSYFNDLPAIDTQMYHRDRNAYKILKVFIYLNDVDEDTGPFQYVLKSHKNWPFLSNRKYRWEDEYIEKKYGQDSIFSATSLMGDVIIADTTGFHKGKKLNKNYRTMLTINYSISIENDGEKVKIRKFEDYPFKIEEKDKKIFKYTSVQL